MRLLHNSEYVFEEPKLYEKAIKLFLTNETISVSLLIEKLKVSNETACRVIEGLEGIDVISSLNNFAIKDKGEKTYFLSDLYFLHQIKFGGAEKVGKEVFQSQKYQVFLGRCFEIAIRKNITEVLGFLLKAEEVGVEEVGVYKDEKMEFDLLVKLKQSGEDVESYIAFELKHFKDKFILKQDYLNDRKEKVERLRDILSKGKKDKRIVVQLAFLTLDKLATQAKEQQKDYLRLSVRNVLSRIYGKV